MRSGVADYYSDERFQKEFKSDPYRNWLPSELFGIGITGKQSFPSGTKPEYSNTNPVILALIIERITNNSIQDEIKKRIFEPLKLSSTQFMELCKPCINGYEFRNENLTNVTDDNMSWTWAAGSLTSNLEDISKFIKYAIGKHKLLSKDATKQQRKFLPFSAGYFGGEREYGFHLLKVEKFIGHNGSLPGYNTFSFYEESTDTTLIVIINITESKGGILPADFITDYIVARLNCKTNYKDALKLIDKINKS
jgi:D-alanyl-D-alanine carboxypeptidase